MRNLRETCFDPGVLSVRRLWGIDTGRCSPRLTSFHRKRLWRGKLLHSLPLRKERSQIRHQRTNQVQVQTEALDHRHPLGAHLLKPPKAAHLLPHMTIQAPEKGANQVQALPSILYRLAS